MPECERVGRGTGAEKVKGRWAIPLRSTGAGTDWTAELGEFCGLVHAGWYFGMGAV